MNCGSSGCVISVQSTVKIEKAIMKSMHISKSYLVYINLHNTIYTDPFTAQKRTGPFKNLRSLTFKFSI